jgi:hypothetical protein
VRYYIKKRSSQKWCKMLQRPVMHNGGLIVREHFFVVERKESAKNNHSKNFYLFRSGLFETPTLKTKGCVVIFQTAMIFGFIQVLNVIQTFWKQLDGKLDKICSSREL